MSVVENAIIATEITWDALTSVAPLPAPPSRPWKWDSLAKTAIKAVRKNIWISRDNSPENIRRECLTVLTQLDPECSKHRPESSMSWWSPISAALKNDLTLLELPTIEGVEAMLQAIEAWWPHYWGQLDKSDMASALAMTEANIEFQFRRHENRSDAMLGRVLWLERLRDTFPGHPVTHDDFFQFQHRRRVLSAGEKHAGGLSKDGSRRFIQALEEMATGELQVPVGGNAITEAQFCMTFNAVGLDRLEHLRVAAALLQTAASLNHGRGLRPNSVTHPVCGYALVFGTHDSGNQNMVVGASPGRWKLQIEGEQYILSYDLWPRPVVMSYHEFGRARGSANAILRDVGISVDSPPGHWKIVWEKYGLRNQLLAAAERIDPRVRMDNARIWLNRIAATAPTAHRPPVDGSAVRLSDGVTVADPRWLVEQAVAEGVILPHEQVVLEREIRRHSGQTNRRDAAKRQRKLLVLDAGPMANENPPISTEVLMPSKNSGDREQHPSQP